MRQKIRKCILFFSFLTFPVVAFYLSPVVIIMGAREGIASGSFVVFSVLFLSSIFLGRAFCSWYCPGGGLQECARFAIDKKAKDGKVNRIKFFIWVPWIITIIFLFIQSGGIKEINFIYQTTKGISVSPLFTYIIYYGIILLIIIPVFIAGRRGFCHSICWMAPFMIIGNSIGHILRIPSLKLKVYSDNCINCKRCDKVCQMSLEINAMVQKGVIADSECILCGECVDICQKNAIVYSFGHK